MFAKCTRVLETASESELCLEFNIGGWSILVMERATRFSHVYRHIGMMEDLRGLIRRPGQGSATL